MPPLLQQQRRQAAGGGFKRSRALWDAALHEKHPTLKDTCRVWFQAIIYELQPIRITNNNINVEVCKSMVVELIQKLWKFIKNDIPSLLRWIWNFILNRTKKQWMIVACIIGYYYIVKFLVKNGADVNLQDQRGETETKVIKRANIWRGNEVDLSHDLFALVSE